MATRRQPDEVVNVYSPQPDSPDYRVGVCKTIGTRPPYGTWSTGLPKIVGGFKNLHDANVYRAGVRAGINYAKRENDA